MGVPVRMSCGVPKNWAGPALEYAKEITPWGIFGKRQYEESDAFEVAYRAKLDRFKFPVARELKAIGERYEGDRLVLLCYENVERQWCHRRMFAIWLEDKTGLDVFELSVKV
jgi:hypothetical protein